MFFPLGLRRNRSFRPARPVPSRSCLAEPLEERLLMALSKASGGSGYSGTLSTNPVIRQQQLICDPAEPAEGSTSVQYEADKVTLSGMFYGPGYGPLGNLAGAVEVEVNGKPQLQSLPSFLDRPLGRELGYVQVFYQLKEGAGQITPPRTSTIVDEEGVEGVDTHALTFDLLPATPSDALVRYAIFADVGGTHAGNPQDYLLTLDGKKLGPADLSPAFASTRPMTGSISGTTFEDVDADGMYNTGDKPIGNVTVYLDLDDNGVLDANDPRQTTDTELGTYLFQGLMPGNYVVREVTPAGYVRELTVPSGGAHEVAVVAGRRSRFTDFGNLRPGTVSGVVFVDANGDGIRERNETAGVVGALVYVDLNRNGLRDRFEPFDRSVAPNGAWAIGGLAPGTYVIRQVPPPGYAQTTPTSAHVVTLTGSGDSFSGVQFGDKPVPPRVTGVYVSGATWSSDFMNYLGTSGLGDPEAGYLIDAATQARAVPWTAVDTLSVRFDSPVRADIGDLAVRGAGLLGYAVTEFAYDAATNTASWRLSRNVVNDRLRLALSSAGVMGASGLALDGEWSNGTDAYPSGDGAPGGDFNFAVNVLGGDSTGDGQVNALDLSYIKQRLNRSVANPGTGSPGAYTIFADLTSDGRINALDLSAAKQRLNRRLPRILPLPLPVEPLDPPVLTVGVQSITRDVFSETPLV